MTPRPITSLSDYGLVDELVGVVHAVIARIAPAARVVDLRHGVPRQDVVAVRELLVYEDAGGAVAVAVNGGDAAALLGVRTGDELRREAP